MISFLFTKTINNNDYFKKKFKEFNLDKHQRIYLTDKAGDIFPSRSFNYYYNYLSFLGYKIINIWECVLNDEKAKSHTFKNLERIVNGTI